MATYIEIRELFSDGDAWGRGRVAPGHIENARY